MTAESVREAVERDTAAAEHEPDDENGHENGEGEPDAPEDVEPESALPAPPPLDHEKQMRKLEAENTRHEKRLAELMGEDFELLDACPCCDLPGFVFPFTPGTERSETKRQMVAAYMGDAEPDYSADPTAETCDKCNGYGVVLSGSKRPETRTIPCDKCIGLGWLRSTAAAPLQPQYQPIAGEVPPQSLDANGSTSPDVWGRPAGHRHYGVPPALVEG